MIGGVRVAAGDVVGEHLGLVPQRGHQAVDHAAVLRALADDVDIHVVDRAHVVVDHDRALHREPGPGADLGVGADAGGDDQQVAVDLAAVLEGEALDPAVAADLDGGGLDQDLDAHLLHRGAQHAAAGGVDLLLHEVGAEVDDGDVAAVGEQAAGGLEPEQAAADDDRLLARSGGGEHAVGVVDGAETVDARGERLVRLVQPGNGRHERPRAGGDQQRVVVFLDAVMRGDDLGEAVDLVDAGAGMQGDAVLLVPVQRVQVDLVVVLLAAEYVGQHDSVVVAVGFVTEHGDLELLGAAAGEHLLDRTGPGHAVAHHHQTLLGHRRCP